MDRRREMHGHDFDSYTRGLQRPKRILVLVVMLRLLKHDRVVMKYHKRHLVFLIELSMRNVEGQMFWHTFVAPTPIRTDAFFWNTLQMNEARNQKHNSMAVIG